MCVKNWIKKHSQKTLDKRYYPVYNTDINLFRLYHTFSFVSYKHKLFFFLGDIPNRRQSERNIPFLFVEMILSYLYSLDKIWFYNVGSLIGSLFYLLAFFKCVIPNANPNILLISTSFISSINFNNCSLFIALYPLYL